LGKLVRVTDLATRLTQRLMRLRYELGKFGVVGIIAYGVDTALFTGLLWSGVERNQAKILATVVAATLAFIGNRFWTWQDRERSGLAREYLLYFFFNAAGLGIQLAVLNFSHSVLGSVWPVLTTNLADVIAAQLVGNGIATVFRFWAYRRFVFVAPATVEVGR
jgi:putative flippase GtrA